MESADDVRISAASTSEITSAVVAASLAIGGGGSTGVGASIGIAVARNFIGYTPFGGEDAAQIQAYVENSSIHAIGDLVQTATASQTINSLVLAGSAAVGAGGSTGVGVSGSGVLADNLIGVDVKAYIDGDIAIGGPLTDGIRAKQRQPERHRHLDDLRLRRRGVAGRRRWWEHRGRGLDRRVARPQRNHQ